MKNSIQRIALLVLFLPLTAQAAEGTRVTLQHVPQFLGRVFMPVVPERVNTLTIEHQPFEAVVEAPAGYELNVANGVLEVMAPAGETAGYARVTAGGRELTLTLMNLVPYERLDAKGRLDGYNVGQYQAKALKGLEQYERPKGFIRLTEENSEMWVSDRYRLRDFQCKLDGDTKFLLLRTEALVKLELLQDELARRHGLEFERFTIMSGYRTPYYNSRIGNDTSYSRHLYGDAMDIYVDTDGDGNMDDVNRDGRVNSKDAKFILDVAASLDESREWSWLKGGAGVYHANAAHGPYIHVDARGYVARWGV